jgi:hypothetical protein
VKFSPEGFSKPFFPAVHHIVPNIRQKREDTTIENGKKKSLTSCVSI